MYSSIEECKRAELVKKCYWPLLNLARLNNLPIGIEASAYTLKSIASIDAEWVTELSKLITDGPCEFIGSGYTQLIGPLVPAEVNAANLRLGMQAYEDILGQKPQIALVNEQAYSCGLLQHYIDAGFKAIIMEWDNPASQHPEWDSNWRYFPQYACRQNDGKIPVIWNKSIAFQQFQRYAHGDQSLDQYLTYLDSHIGNNERAFPLYGNDAEVFDFRPGRFKTEAALQGESEWQRLRVLFERIIADKRFTLIPPSEVLDLLDQPGGGQMLQLESPEQPVPVKKQGKYNLTRWALTGRGDLNINSSCYALYSVLKSDPKVTDEQWQELCYLWSSDFRTHITEKRWQQYEERLDSFKGKLLKRDRSDLSDHQFKELKAGPVKQSSSSRYSVKREDQLLIIESNNMLLKLNCRRGLAIDGLWIDQLDGPPLIGTLPHGFYQDIRYGADWYSGHMVLELFARSKITDLEAVEPEIEFFEETVSVKGILKTELGSFTKTILVDTKKSQLYLYYQADWNELPAGSLRLGHITINPQAFDNKSLFYRTCNGGYHPEDFKLKGRMVDHGRAVSFLVSASGGLGMTEGWVEMGDSTKRIRVSVNQELAALIGLVKYEELADNWFCRLAFSAGEMDDTVRSRVDSNGVKDFVIKVELV